MRTLRSLRKSGQHFDGDEPAAVSGGIDARYAIIHRATGKTIDRIQYGEDHPTLSGVHHGEYLVLRFTDGTALSLQIASDAWNLQQQVPGFKARDLTCSMFPHFHETGKVILD
jgi:hypothetical protein